MVQNPKYWKAKECYKTPLGNVNKEESHFSSCVLFCFGVWHILLLSNILDFVPCDLQLQRAYRSTICICICAIQITKLYYY